MTEADKQWADQFDVHLPAALEASQGKLEGDLVTLSPGSVLFASDGHLEVDVVVDGKAYRGRMVRAGAGADSRMNYVVQLEQPLPVDE